METQVGFKDVADGYGFEEIEQSVNGIYCDGCMYVHKRPTKMYRNGPLKALWVN